MVGPPSETNYFGGIVMSDYRNSNSSHPISHPEQAGCLPVILRVFWMMIGHAGACLCVIYMFLNQPKNLSILDGLFWCFILLTLLARYVDIAIFKGETSDGEPATLKHFQKHLLVLLPIATLTWLFLRWSMLFG
jgi:hypothetical protein